MEIQLNYTTIISKAWVLKAIRKATLYYEKGATIDVEYKRTVGIYPKIWSMVLQQGFGNPGAIPIDNWIETFYSIPLKIDSKEDFLNSFQGMGKLERMLWVTAQARKTNMFSIFNWVWCLKYGTGKTI